MAIVPAGAAQLTAAGHEVTLETAAGQAAGFPDEEYREKGAQVAASREEVFSRADVILQVRGHGANPSDRDLGHLRPEQVVIGFLESLAVPEATRELAQRGVTAYAMEMVPRTTRAQSMDALSSMATIAGYAGSIMAAVQLPRMFPMMMTAAGTITPARVFVVGAGVAGLQAIATSRRLGAVVKAYDVRPVVREQVESLGAQFVELPLETVDAEASGGYAKAQDEAFYRRQREMMTEVVAQSDVVVTTASVPGKKAPVLITDAMVAGMAPGSVVVDVAAERGGNCELTRPGETVEVHGVTILGPANLGSHIPYHASQMYSKNIISFLLHVLENQEADLGKEDEIVKETLVARGGEVVHPRVLEALGQVPATATDGGRG